jgi:integrase/recombinase XerD
MFLSKRKNGFYYVYYEDTYGKRNKVSTKAKLKSDANEFLSKFQEELKLRAARKLNTVRLSEFMVEILNHSESVHSPKTTSNYRTTFKSLINHFGDVQLSTLTKANIENYIEKRIYETSIYAGRKDLAYLSASFRYAVNRKYLSENLCLGIRTPKVPEKMPLFLSRDEFQILLSVIDNADIADLVTFAVNTGCRQGEVISLLWSQVNLDERRLILDNRAYMTKSKRVRTIPLNKTVIELLKRRKEKSSNEFVFTLEGKEVDTNRMNKLFKKYVKKAKLNPSLHYHNLRHSFASWLVMQGVSLYQVQRLLGHQTSSVTQIYAHLTNDNLAATVEKLMEPGN